MGPLAAGKHRRRRRDPKHSKSPKSPPPVGGLNENIHPCLTVFARPILFEMGLSTPSPLKNFLCTSDCKGGGVELDIYSTMKKNVFRVNFCVHEILYIGDFARRISS